MANNKEQKLFEQFPPVSTQEWEAVITADLKGADYERKLVWKTQEGFNVKPYYRAEDLKEIQYLKIGPGQFPYVRGVKANNNWLVHQTIVVESAKEANTQAIELLTKGVESIGLNLSTKEFSKEDLDTLLRGIPLQSTEITFCGEGVQKAANHFVDLLEKSSYDIEEVRVNFLIDPIIKKVTLKGKEPCKEGKCFTKMANLIKDAGKYKRIRFVGVNGQTFHNSGSTIVQELAFTLAVGHEYVVKLMEAGLTVDQVAPSLRFGMAISTDYFMEIAKMRAARLLWANIMAPYKPSRGCSSKMRIHAVSSKWNMTIYDPYVNMLRATTEAMSAAIGGVHSMEVLPFDDPFEKASHFSSRIARNTQLLLKEESHFDQVADAAGGSYYIETLTRSIAEQAWALFKEVEKRGGYLAAFQAGFIQEQIEAAATKKAMNIATRRDTLLGTNQYPNFTEVAHASTLSNCSCGCGCGPECTCGCQEGKPCSCSGDCSCGGDCGCGGEQKRTKALRPYRGAMPFEQMRMKVDRSGKEPKAFMLTVGSRSFARARAQFACNFFACAGIRVEDNVYFKHVEEGVKAALAAKAEIVVICASDEDYAMMAPEAFKLLGSKAILVVAGAPGCQAELEAGGIKNFISMKSNVLETLNHYLKELGI